MDFDVEKGEFFNVSCGLLFLSYSYEIGMSQKGIGFLSI